MSQQNFRQAPCQSLLRIRIPACKSMAVVVCVVWSPEYQVLTKRIKETWWRQRHRNTTHNLSSKPELSVSLQCQSLVPTPKPTCPALYRFNSAGTTKILALSRGKFLFLPLTLFKAALAKYQSSAIRVTLKVRVVHANDAWLRIRWCVWVRLMMIG